MTTALEWEQFIALENPSGLSDEQQRAVRPLANAPHGRTLERSRFGGSVSGVGEVVAAFVGLDGGEEAAEMSPGVLGGSFLRGAHPMFDLGEGLLDRIEIG